MIRVAQIVGKMNGGGVESVVMNYYRHIDSSEVQFDFIVDSDSKRIPKEEIEDLGGKIFVVPPYQCLPRYMIALNRLFRAEQWSIVHSHINTLSAFPLMAAKQAKIPVRIAHSHSSSGGGEGEGAKDALKFALRRFANTFPTHRLACSEVAGKWLFGNKPFEVVRNAVDTLEFCPDEEGKALARAKLGLRDNSFVVGHIGRMVPPKNHSRLLRIFKTLLSNERESVLLLVGNGPLEDRIRREAIQLGVIDKVMFLGQISNVAYLYQAFDVFCLPSIYEGLPVVAVECQASGTPILASSEVTSEAAVTSLMKFESLRSSDEKWAERLLSLRDRKSSDADKESMRTFDIRENAQKLEKLYVGYIAEMGS